MIVQTDKYSFKLKFKQIGTVLNESFSGLAPFNFAKAWHHQFCVGFTDSVCADDVDWKCNHCIAEDLM